MSIRSLAFVASLVIASAALAQNNQLEVSNAWARATPGKAETGAAYLTIQSPTADRLLSASSPVAKKTELHTMSMEGMVMKMRPLEGLGAPLREGQSFPLTLTFEKAGTRTVTVAIEKPGAAGPAVQR
jgi:periplasmic copper chaperone A